MSYWQNTSTKAPMIGQLRAEPRGGRLGRKLVLRILLLNAMLSIVASGIQLYASYQRDRNQVLGTIEVVDESFRSGFEEALWEYNFPLVEALLDGVISKPEVQYLSLSAENGRTWVLGEKRSSEALSEKMDFHYTKASGEMITVGSLEIQLTFQAIRSRVWSQLWTLLVSNFAKTIVASALLMMLFERAVGRHLSQIAARVSEGAWRASDARLELDRQVNDNPDDLDHIVGAINTAKARNEDAIVALKNEVAIRRGVEEALRHRTQALEEANREQAQFTYAISHDLKSPANTITMLLQELEMGDDNNMNEDSREILGDARRTVSRMTQLVEDILGYARAIEEGMQTEVVNLHVAAQEIVEDLRGEIVKAGADVVIDDLPTIIGNRAQLRMLLQNLISNAVKFRSADRAPKIVVSSSSANKPGHVKITVTDNGIGIAPEYHEKVFGLFQRLHSYGEYDGSGLGLTLCKRIVTNHAGQITLSSQRGQGTTFDITLPRENHGS